MTQVKDFCVSDYIFPHLVHALSPRHTSTINQVRFPWCSAALYHTQATPFRWQGDYE